ncbi:hypothetical protein TRFO_36418 [Tritrichomonas foetus]|uniref:E3 ubiquitin-protein ligase n=1 Tax=Tritrichomonas foetus TaxID=1144522 RepID=A0A1J4JII8_9EUKA|nr:hypothetical protein TRFO_36418 [Tritrichomonas foetus]|eukprot:OHS97363.1 hypothetical protein TRFO_36418 [Tritrichomonas foetus]
MLVSLHFSHFLHKMDESLYKSLSLLFSIDQDSAFRHCESILCGSNFRSFPDFINYYRKKLKCHTCQASWDDGCLAGHCLDCQKVDNSCICIKCFIEGGHSNHRAYLTKSGMGNCDCGDISFWKKEGFCPSHSGYDENSESSELPPELREKMIAVFCAALKNFIFLGNHDFEHFEDLIDWLNVFIPIGDAFRRCVCIAFNRIFRQSGFIMAISTFKKESMDLMINFFGSLINDSEFSLHFGYRSLVEYPTLVWMMLKTVADQTTNDIEVLQTFQEFCFHSFAPQTIEFLVQQSEDKDEEEEQEGDEKQESGQANETKNEIENNADKSHEIALQSNDITATKLYNSSKETNQSKTNIEETDIEETNIEETNIEETDIEETNIEETNIEETDIEETNIEETITEEINTEKYNHRSNSDRLTERKSIMNSQLNSRKMETKSTLNTKFHTEKKKNPFHQSKNESKKKKLCYLNEPCDWVSIFEEILVLLLNFYSRDPSFAFFSKTKMDNHFSHLQSLLLLASKITHQEKKSSTMLQNFRSPTSNARR